MQRRSLSLTLDSSDEDNQIADRLSDVLLGEIDQDIVITHDVLFSFDYRYGKSFFILLAEAMEAGTLRPGTVLKFDVYALADDRLDELHAAIQNNPEISYCLKLEAVNLPQVIDDDLELGNNGMYSRLLNRLADLQNLLHTQNIDRLNRVRVGFYQLRHGFFANTRVPRDVQALLLHYVANACDIPQGLAPHDVLTQLDRIRNEELQRRDANAPK